jgi:hypothetical protein
VSRARDPATASARPHAAVAIGDALDGSAALARLTHRVRESQRRLADLALALPPALQDQVRSGPLDDQAWTLLAANAAVAAKLRNLLPVLEARLTSQGWPPRTLRVKTAGER